MKKKKDPRSREKRLYEEEEERLKKFDLEKIKREIKLK